MSMLKSQWTSWASFILSLFAFTIIYMWHHLIFFILVLFAQKNKCMVYIIYNINFPHGKMCELSLHLDLIHFTLEKMQTFSFTLYVGSTQKNSCSTHLLISVNFILKCKAALSGQNESFVFHIPAYLLLSSG